MNAPVSFELSKLLKEEGYSKPCEYFWQDRDLSFSPSGLKKTKNGKKMNHNKYDDFIYSAPTIAEVVMWLYEKHGIWTVVNVNIMGSWYFEHFDLKKKRNAQFKPTDTHYDSSTEAYSQAILYTLKNLI